MTTAKRFSKLKQHCTNVDLRKRGILPTTLEPRPPPARLKCVIRNMLNNSKVKISLVIVFRNCESVIERSLQSLLDMDVPVKYRELILIDGESTDETMGIVENFLTKHRARFHRVIVENNTKLSLAAGWNLAISLSSATYMMRIDAHGTVQNDYCGLGIDFLSNHSEACAVGGWLETVPQKNNRKAIVISKMMSSRLCVGNSPFRILSSDSAPKEADTAAYAVYKVEDMKSVGCFNESLLRTQDLDLHDKLLSTGRKIFFHPLMHGTYAATYSINLLAKKAFKTGYWVTFSNRARTRHKIPTLLFLYLLTLPASVAAFGVWASIPLLVYGLLLLYVGTRVTKDILGIFATCTYHLCYGLGGLIGTLRRLIQKPT